jgi:hypothetical protein
VYRSGNVYDGDWSNDVPHGKGIFLEGNVIYDIEHNQGTVSPCPETHAHSYLRQRPCMSSHCEHGHWLPLRAQELTQRGRQETMRQRNEAKTQAAGGNQSGGGGVGGLFGMFNFCGPAGG